MKIKTERVFEFKPIKLELTFETEEEVGTFYALFNHMGIVDIIKEHGKISACDIRKALTNVGYDPDNVIANRVHKAMQVHMDWTNA